MPDDLVEHDDYQSIVAKFYLSGYHSVICPGVKDVAAKYQEQGGQNYLFYLPDIEEIEQSWAGDRLEATEVSLVNVYQDGIYIYLEDSFGGAIVADAGLPRPTDQVNTQNSFSMTIGKEQLYIADADAIFVWSPASNNSEDAIRQAQGKLKQLKAAPLWSKLNAMQQDKVYAVSSYWLSMGSISANLVLDDLFKQLRCS